jgi:pheromone shutdown protein TraB
MVHYRAYYFITCSVCALQPDTVMIELDSSRVQKINKSSLQGGALAERGPEQTAALARKAGDTLSPAAVQDAAKASSTPSLITRVLGGILGKALTSLYKKLDGMGFESGKEFRVAIAEAQSVNAKVLLGDRPVQQTLDALATAARATGYRKIMSADLDAVQLQAAGLDPSSMQMDKAGIAGFMESLKTREKVRSLMTAIRAELPLLYNAMVRERDQYMANSLGGYLQSTGNKCAVGVVGIAHMDGIEEFLQQDFGFKLVNPRRLLPAV